MNDDVREIFDEAAASYDRYAESPLTQRALAAVIAAVERRLPPGSAILDVGAGTGTFAIPLAKAGYRVTANDVAPKMLEVVAEAAQEAGVQARTVCGDIRSIDVVEPYDAAISVHGPLNYHPRPAEIVEAITRHVRPGGVVVLVFSRGAALEQLPRHPRRALVPFSRSGFVRVDARIGERSFDLYLHDPDALARTLGALIDVEQVAPCGVSLHLPTRLDVLAAHVPVLRRLGASTIVVGRVRRQ